MSEYHLEILAKDKGIPSFKAHCNLTIAVIDINDNAPIFVFNEYTKIEKEYIFSTSDQNVLEKNEILEIIIPKYKTTVIENVSLGLKIMEISAKDCDEGVNAKITYNIVGEVSNIFEINNITGDVVISG